MNTLFEKFLVWILVVVFNKLKKKYPNGLISQYALVDVEELDQTLQEKINSLEPDVAKSQLIEEFKADSQALINKIKEKLIKSK